MQGEDLVRNKLKASSKATTWSRKSFLELFQPLEAMVKSSRWTDAVTGLPMDSSLSGG
jgi:hypothetical protein